MKIFAGYLMLALALAISSVAAYFSVVGLSALFAATAGAVVVMGITLEAGKLATASWVHSNWRNPKVNGILRAYLVIAVVALMLITSLGIYGFLAKGHLEQSTPLAPIELQIASKQSDIDAAKADLKSQNERLAQLDAAVNSMIGGDKAERGLKYRHSQAGERTEIQKAITADNAKLQTLSQDLVPLKLKISDVETKLGPVKYVADLFGLKDTESAVRIVIMIIMFAFDPLAVVMVLSAVISISDGLEDRRNTKSNKRKLVLGTLPLPENTISDEEFEALFSHPVKEPETETSAELSQVSNLDENVTSEEEQAPVEEQPVEKQPEVVLEENPEESVIELHSDKSDKEILLDILERKPELLQEIVEAIHDQNNRPKDGVNESWLDSGPK